MKSDRPEWSLAEDVLRAAVQYVATLSPRFNWVGIYILKGDTLELGPFVGAPTRHTRIGVGVGVCGAAVERNEDMNVADVSTAENYLACSLETRSELVVLIRDGNGRILGQIDIDSHTRRPLDPGRKARSGRSRRLWERSGPARRGSTNHPRRPSKERRGAARFQASGLRTPARGDPVNAFYEAIERDVRGEKCTGYQGSRSHHPVVTGEEGLQSRGEKPHLDDEQDRDEGDRTVERGEAPRGGARVTHAFVSGEGSSPEPRSTPTAHSSSPR